MILACYGAIGLVYADYLLTDLLTYLLAALSDCIVARIHTKTLLYFTRPMQREEQGNCNPCDVAASMSVISNHHQR